MAIRFIYLEKAYATTPREMTMGTLRWVGVPEGEVRLVEGTYEDAKCRVLCEPGVSGESIVNVGLTQGSALSPLLFIAVMKLISKKICTKDILRKLLYSYAWPGSSRRRGSKSPRTADRGERYVQQTWTESMFGEDGGNADGT